VRVQIPSSPLTTRPVRLAAGCETLNLAAWVRFPYGSLLHGSFVLEYSNGMSDVSSNSEQTARTNRQRRAKWWNLVDTRRSERRARRAWEFESPLRHCSVRNVKIAGVAGAQLGFISSTRPARYRDLQLGVEHVAGGPVLIEVSYASIAGCDPRTRYLKTAGYANRKSDEVESLVILWVRLPPRSLKSVPWSNGEDACVTCRRVMVQLHPHHGT
jgi:hypothetical protein